eukprot:9051646-Alexandrium_andersonii.AAC.1
MFRTASKVHNPAPDFGCWALGPPAVFNALGAHAGKRATDGGHDGHGVDDAAQAPELKHGEAAAQAAHKPVQGVQDACTFH